MAALLSDGDRERIEQAIAELERESAIELVVSVVRESASYAEWRALCAGLWAIAAGLAAFEALPERAQLWVFPLQALIGWGVYRLLGWGGLGRRLLPKHEVEQNTRARAYQLFAECGIHRTRGGTGILLLLSELEHRAVLLGDHAVHTVVGDAGWTELAGRVVARIRSGRAADGVLELIEALKTGVAQHFPAQPGDIDELPNRVVRRD